MRTSFTLKVGVLAGMSFKSTVNDAKTLAKRLGLAYIDFDFNGVRCSIGPNADTEEAIKQFSRAIRTEDPIEKYVIVA